MDYRQGTCTGCKNSFRVPATFTADKAKCPKCSGVVEIGPVQAAAAKSGAAPAAKPVPASVPAPKPEAAAAPKPAATPAAKPASVAATPKPVARPAAPAAAAPKPVPAASKPASSAGSVRAVAEDAARKVKASGSSRAGKEESDSGTKRPRHVPAKKSMAPLISAAVAILFMGGIGYWYFAIHIPQADAAQASEKQRLDDERLAKQAEEQAKQKAADEAAAAAAARRAEQAAQAADSGAGAAGAAKKPDPKPAAEVVDDIELKDLAELGKWSQSTDEQWTELQGLAAQFVDLSGGARSGRAGKKLEQFGRAAYPALLNQFRSLNLYTEDGYRQGDLIQKTLERIANGRNFGWQYSTEVKDVVYNKKAIKKWFSTWETVGEDDAQWNGFTKQTKPTDDAGGEKKGEIDDF